MMWILLSAAAVAADNDIGTLRRFGLGVTAGVPFSVSAKWMADRRHGVALHVGAMTSTTGVHSRLQYEQWSRRLRSWAIGELGIGWQAGLVVNMVFGQAAERQSARFGITLGPVVEFRLAPVPVSLFGELSPVFYPLAVLPGSTFFPVGLTLVVGVRVFIGRAKGASRVEADLEVVPIQSVNDGPMNGANQTAPAEPADEATPPGELPIPEGPGETGGQIGTDRSKPTEAAQAPVDQSDGDSDGI